jgi:gas vesicle protein
MMKSNVFTYVTSFAFGAAAGAAFALLNAPQSGKKTRTQLRKGASDVRYRTKKAITRTRARAMDKLDDVQSVVKGIGDGAMHQAERLKMVGQQIAAKPKAILERANGK